MGKKISSLLIAICSLVFQTNMVYAKGAGTTAGETLTQPTSARAVALGEAFSAVADDATAFHYNPGLLPTLKSSHASFMYQKGIFDNSRSNILFGLPLKNDSGLGVSLGYMDAGDLDLGDGSTKKAMSDLSAMVGYGKKIKSLSLGANVKYLSSKVAEEVSAHAYAMDLGLYMPLHERIGVGASLQNLGSSLKYRSESAPLDRTARAGVSWMAMQARTNVMIVGDVLYHMVQKETQPGIGVEVGVGPLALRAGYRKTDLTDVTFGAGFLIGGFSIDYSYGLTDIADASQLASVSMRFGGPSSAQEVSRTDQKVAKEFRPIHLNQTSIRKSHDKIYEVKEGDTLKVIALRVYGDPEMASRIQDANEPTLGDSAKLVPGQKVVLP